MKVWIVLIGCLCVWVLSMCTNHSTTPVASASLPVFNPKANILRDRIMPPQGYWRTEADSTSFAAYLLHLPLKPDGSKVTYYNGETKTSEVYCAVVDLPIGNKNLQQCADAAIRLRAEYLYRQKQYNAIGFHFTNGFLCTYTKWKEGYRVSVKGNTTSWVKSAAPDNSYKTFWSYLETVFSYAGTKSLPSDMMHTGMSTLKAGDVFLTSGSPGHAVMVMDVVTDTLTGKRKMLLGQSYMPAQDIQILTTENGPWFDAEDTQILETPEWVFNPVTVYRFRS